VKKVILLLSAIEIVAFFIIVIRFDLGFDQIMSLFGIFINIFALCFLSYGVIHHIEPEELDLADIGEGGGDTQRKKHLRGVRLYHFIGIVFIVLGSISQSVGVIFSG